MKLIIIKIIHSLFKVTIYNWNPAWFNLSKNIKINQDLINKLRGWNLLKSLLINPFNSDLPFLLKSQPGLNWKINKINKVGFKVLFLIEMLCGLSLYSFTFGLILWAPIRMMIYLGMFGIFSQLPMIEPILLLIEKVYTYLVNNTYNFFFPDNSWFGSSREVIQTTSKVKKASLDDIYKALKPLENLPSKVQEINLLNRPWSVLESNKKWIFNNVITDAIKSPIDNIGTFSIIFLIVGGLLGIYYLSSAHPGLITDWMGWGFIKAKNATIYSYNILTNIGNYGLNAFSYCKNWIIDSYNWATLPHTINNTNNTNVVSESTVLGLTNSPAPAYQQVVNNVRTEALDVALATNNSLAQPTNLQPN